MTVSTASGSLVFNPGGPGAPGVAFLAAAAASLPGELRDRFDLVAFDPRGVGDSSPVDCVDSLDPVFDESFEPTTPAARADLVDAMRSLAASCAERSGDLLTHLSTADTVQDLERLRVALGDEQLSFVGSSYGTFLGASYADAYPDRVRAFVLDGPIDPTMDATQVALGQARGFERALDHFLADCSQHPGCAFHHDGDAEGAYDALRAQAARAPLPADDSTGRRLNQTRFDAAVLQELYSGQSSWSGLADAFARCRGGRRVDAARGGRLVRGPRRRRARRSRARGLLGGDLPRRSGGRGARRRGRRSSSHAVAVGAAPGRVHRQQQPALLRVAGARRSRRQPPDHRPGAPPILVVGTTRDPATPLVQARA